MSSIVANFEYDIFISYRHNDNRSGWVTEFVEVLQEELAATIKEPLSIYFDKNPHDGLLETHQVDKSLEGKLKCLLFIPIISQTYCDPKSFAWQHEFCVFNKLAKEDQFGRDIKSHNGNVVSRILPVKIHELDEEDKATLENEIGCVLRAIEFIYKEPGVNRSLKPNDSKNENSNKTDYRNQTNKIANACKEVISSLKNFGKPTKTPLSQTQELKTPAAQSIVVLPFENISNDPDQEYFSDGLTEEIIADLSKLSSLHVISRTSAMVFKGSKKDLKTIGQELNVRYVLEGSVRKAGNKLRITAQLIDASSDAHLWAEKFDGVLDDVFDIQEKVSHAIVDSLRLELTPQERERLVVKSPADPAAHELYLAGRYHLNQTTPSGMFKAIELFEAAIQKDPGYALVYAGLANCYAYLGWLGAVAREVFPKAKQAAAKALEIDENLAEAHGVLGYAATYYDWDWTTAERELKRAIALNPNYAQGYLHYCFYMATQGRFEESRTAILRAKELDPFSIIIHANLMGSYHFGRDYARALMQSRKALALAPDAPIVLIFHGLACCGNKLYEEAANVFKKLVDVTGGSTSFKGYLGYSYAMAGQKENALAILNELTITSKSEQVPSFQFFLALLGLERFEDALTWLEKTVEERSGGFLPHIRHECVFDSLRDHPRFQELVRRIFPE